MPYLLILILTSLITSSCASFLSFFERNNGAVYSGVGQFPPRRSFALSGSKFIAMTEGMSIDQREQAIYQQIAEGNVPAFLRIPQSITLQGRAGGRAVKATVWVLPDYLAIGSDSDYVRIPMNPMTAQKLADKFGFVLPTPKLVDEIYKRAAVKLAPMPMPPGAAMTTNSYYRRHNVTIQSQLSGKRLGRLVAGHKKDIVVTNRLQSLPTRVAIYGWHRLNGQPIQPLSLVHGNHYADYSHGVRFILHNMQVDGKSMAVSDVFTNPSLSTLVSDEGRIVQPRLRTL